MKKMFVQIGLLLLVSASASLAHAKTQIHLMDFSGSLIDCTSMMKTNLEKVNLSIDTLEKGDRFVFWGYRSSGQPFQIADMRMPGKRGPQNRFLLEGRQQVREQIQKSFENLPSILKKSGGDTDIIGALNHVLLAAGELDGEQGIVVLHHYSDGVQTTNTGSFNPDQYKNYLSRLSSRLKQARLVHPPTVSKIVWEGGLCLEEMSLPLEDTALLQSELRRYWVSFLNREMPNVAIEYQFNY
jgi:hypothetical protein